MGRRALVDTTHAALLDAFRKAPGDFTVAAKAAGCSKPTAIKAWSQGWPHHRAIRDIVAEERTFARALLSKATLAMEANAAPIEATKDGAQSAAVEALVSRAVRGAALDSLREVATLRGHASYLVGIVAADRQVTADAALDRLKTINSLAKSAAELARHAVELERLRLGDPTSIVALQMNEPAQVSVEDARAELEALSRAVGHVNGVNGSGVQQ